MTVREIMEMLAKLQPDTPMVVSGYEDAVGEPVKAIKVV